MRIKFILIFILGSSCLTAKQNPSCLHVVVVMATNDDRLGKGTTQTIKNIEELSLKIAESYGFSSKIYKVIDDKFNIENAFKIIDEIHIENDDLILYYVYGHGWLYHDNRSKFPNIFISYANNTDPNLLSRVRLQIEKVHERINMKNPRLALIIFDACSPIVSQAQAGDEPKQVNYFLLGKEIDSKSNNKNDLFSRAKGYIKISSSSRNEFANGNSGYGSFFSYFFLKEMNSYLDEEKNKSWDEIFEPIKQKVFKFSRQSTNNFQTPHYEKNINIQYESDRNSNLITTTSNQYEGYSNQLLQYTKLIKKGIDLYKLGRYELAKQKFKQAINIKPNDPWAQYCINICEASLGYTKFENMNYRESYVGLNDLSRNATFSSRNFAASQYVLGVLYLKGYGCKKNKKLARKWLEIACRNGHIGAKTILSLYGIFKC